MTENVDTQEVQSHKLDEHTDLPEGLHSGNADEYVPVPTRHTWTHVDGMSDDTKVSVRADEWGEGIDIALAFGEPGKPRGMLLEASVPLEQLLALYEDIIAPLFARRKEIERLSALAYEREEAERARENQEFQQLVDAAAFRLQEMKYRERRLHRHNCPMLNAARVSEKPLSLEELLTKHLPAVRHDYDTLLSPPQIRSNQRARDSRHGQKKAVLSLCGRCKPIGPRSKDVSESLHYYAHLTESRADAMTKVVRLLVEIEQGAELVDAEYQQQRRTGESQ